MPQPPKDVLRSYLQAMPRVALIGGLLAAGTHLYFGLCPRSIIVSLIVGCALPLVIILFWRRLAHRSPQRKPYTLPYTLLFLALSGWLLLFTGFKISLQPQHTALSPEQPILIFGLILIRYFATVITIHALILMLIGSARLHRITGFPPHKD